MNVIRVVWWGVGRGVGPVSGGVGSHIAFLRWSNDVSTVYTTMAHGCHTTLCQCSFERWRMVGSTLYYNINTIMAKR